jgi:hypothetical protein
MSRAGHVHHRVDCYARIDPATPVDQFELRELSDADAVAEGKLHALQRGCDYFLVRAITRKSPLDSGHVLYDSRRG